MSLRYFEGQEHAKVYSKFRPVPPPTLVVRLVGFLREKYEGPLNAAVDLGCGNGQCAFTLAKEFASVLGTDISPAQISEARELCAQLKYENVKFETSPAEIIPLPDNSVQLITICEAAHWMDLPKVYEESKRVLTQNGVLAMMGYWNPIYTPVPVEDASKADAINSVYTHRVNFTDAYRAPEIWHVFREYSDITIPFDDFTRERGFPYQLPAKMNDILGSIRSYSSFQNMIKEKGQAAGEEQLQDLSNRITDILNEGREKPLTPEEVQDYEFTSTWSYFLIMARVSNKI